MMDLKSLKGRVSYQVLKAILGGYVSNIYYGEFSVEGSENIPEEGPFLLLPYHDSMRNIFEIGAAVDRTLVYVSRTGVFRNRAKKTVFEFGMQLANTIFLDRDNLSIQNGRQTYSQLYSELEWAVKNNLGMVVFPEATRNWSGIVGRGKSSLVRMVYELGKTYSDGIPLIAVGIEADPREKGGSVTIRFAEQIHPQNRQSIGMLVNEQIMPTIARLSGKEFDPRKNLLREYRESAARNNR